MSYHSPFAGFLSQRILIVESESLYLIIAYLCSHMPLFFFLIWGRGVAHNPSGRRKTERWAAPCFYLLS
jgi:hypothetical protein